jgi:hypothetical protein
MLQNKSDIKKELAEEDINNINFTRSKITDK